MEDLEVKPYRVFKYGEHPRQRVSIYDYMQPFSEQLRVPPLIFIHGGAWRDPNNTDRDADKFQETLAKPIPLCSVDYRLSTEDKCTFPGFVDDVAEAVAFCVKQFKTDRISLLGHSVGAMLALQLLDRLPAGVKVDQIYLVEAIVDLEELIQEYPSYKGFVDEAHEDYKQVKISLEKLKDVQVHIIQSYEDELLSMGQTTWLQQQLQRLGIEYNFKAVHWGEHNPVYENPKLAEYVNRNFL